MKKILYIVATQYDNMGDLLINKCLIDELVNYGTVYLDTKNVPGSFKSVLLEHPNTKELSEISDISLKGMGLFLPLFRKDFSFDYVFKSPGPFGGSITFNQKIRAVLFYFIFLIMKMRGAKSILIGNDFLLNSNFDSWIVRLYSRVLYGIYLRSVNNVNSLELLGVSNVQYSPDLCFMMKIKIYDFKKDTVGISFRDMGEIPNQRIRSSVKVFVDYFSKRKIRIDFFYQVKRDRNFNQELFEEFKTPYTYFRDEVLSWDERNYYKNKICLLSNRLHVLLLGQVFEAIPYALVFNQSNTFKIRNIFESVGIEDRLFDQIDSSDLDLISTEVSELRGRIRGVNSKQLNIFNKKLEEIFSL